MARPKKIVPPEEPESIETVEEYLARGGTITVCDPFARSEEAYVGQWGRRLNGGTKAAADAAKAKAEAAAAAESSDTPPEE